MSDAREFADDATRLIRRVKNQGTTYRPGEHDIAEATALALVAIALHLTEPS